MAFSTWLRMAIFVRYEMVISARHYQGLIVIAEHWYPTKTRAQEQNNKLLPAPLFFWLGIIQNDGNPLLLIHLLLIL